MTYVGPEVEQFEAFKDLPRDTPINMINLIRLKDEAEYEGNAPEDVVTGADAYKTYGKESGPVLARVGGEVIWHGQPTVTLIGPVDEAWDLAFIVRYPSAAAFMDMVTDPAYQKAVQHRQAAVQDSRLIRCEEQQGGSIFG